MSKKVFMIFDNKIDRQKQAFWFVNTFIKEEHRDLYLLSRIYWQSSHCAIACGRIGDTWVLIPKQHVLSYTRGMTQVFYPTKNMGEL